MAQGIETKTGRVPNVAGEGAVYSGLKTRQLQSGLSQLSTSFKDFGKASDARRIQNDIITARTAYALNEEMPGSLAPEAELAYNGLVATRSTQQFFRLLSDDADVYGNGLLTDDENYPDHNSKQAAFEQFIEGAKKTFFDQAQFNPAQQESIIQYVANRSNTFKTAFATLAAKDIKVLKKNEASKFIQENIIDRQTRFNQVKTNTNKATQGWTPKTHIKESSAFSRDWHEDLKKKLSIANPHLSEDELDDMIIQQIGLLATDPDNPHPEYLEYFNESGKGGKPAINIIPSLAQNARALYNSARSAFISHNKANITLANKIQTDNENLAHINAQNWVIQEIGNIQGHRNLSKMTTALRKQFPHITATKLQSVINWASTLITADKKDGNPKIAARLVLQAARGKLSMLEFEEDPRTKNLNQSELTEVQKTITNYSVGKIKQNQKVFIEEADSLRDLIETERIKFNRLTGKPEGFSPKIQSIMDAIVNQYQDMGEVALHDAKNDDPRDARKELNAIKYQMLRNLGLLDDGNKHKIKTKKVKDSRDYGTSAAELFNSQLAEDTSKEAIASTPSGIDHIFKADVPDDYNPATHVPPTSLFFLNSLSKKAKVTPRDVPKLPDDSMSPTPLKSSPEVSSEKDNIVPRDVPTDAPRSIEPVPVTKTLNRAEQRSEAFDKARPDVPNEKNELRKLQDTAKFQDDRTIFDAVKDTVKKAFGESKSTFDNIKSNNPLNVEKRKTKWQGEVDSTSNRFVAADTPLNGMRLGVANFLAKFQRGLTLAQTIEEISPKKDANPTSDMIALASKLSKIGADEKLEVSMENFKAIKQITKALLKFEAPNNTYPDSLIDEGVKAAIKSKVNSKDSPNLKVSSLQKMFGTSEAEASKIQMMGNTKGTSPTIYKIKQGDTLSKIAKDNDMTVQELQKLNNIKNVNKIRAGQAINIGRFSMDIKDIKPPQVPDDVPKIFKESLIPIYGSHVNAALKHFMAANIERAGLPVPNYYRKIIFS